MCTTALGDTVPNSSSKLREQKTEDKRHHARWTAANLYGVVMITVMLLIRRRWAHASGRKGIPRGHTPCGMQAPRARLEVSGCYRAPNTVPYSFLKTAKRKADNISTRNLPFGMQQHPPLAPLDDILKLYFPTHTLLHSTAHPYAALDSSSFSIKFFLRRRLLHINLLLVHTGFSGAIDHSALAVGREAKPTRRIQFQTGGGLIIHVKKKKREDYFSVRFKKIG
ncbi:hypothetical protein V8E53_013601 [Lactarius tabidus]